MNPDPTERLSFWTAILGATVTWTGYVAVHPGCVQRFISLPTYRRAQLWVILSKEYFPRKFEVESLE
jgi:sodium-coupled monocarboxylate transporter 8/12